MSSLNPIGIPFIELPTVDSTNNYAMGMVRAAMAQHGTAVFAHEQTKGKGQRNKEWNSSKNQNIALSLIIEPKRFNCGHLFMLSMAVATAVHEFMGFYSEEFKIKWPNDLYWRDRKAAGILIENLWQGNEWKYAIAGIGININQEDFGELVNKAISLKQITANEFEPVELAKKFCLQFEDTLKELKSNPEKIVSSYKKNLYKVNEVVRLKKDNRVFEAMVKDVTQDGKLVVEHGIEESFDVGEVEWII